MLSLSEHQKKVEATNVRIPKGFKIPARTIDSHLNIRNKCLFVAKGPSLAKVNDFKDFGHVATVNESCLRVPGPIDYAFFYDERTIEGSRPAWDRIKTFVISPIVYGGGVRDFDLFTPLTEIRGFPVDRLLTFYEDQHEWDYQKMEESAEIGRLLNTDTAVMGLNFLVWNGYEHIYLLGHDGGIGYADGVGISGNFVNRDLSRFREIMEVAIQILTKHNRLKVEFYDGKIFYSDNYHTS
jgi:hypothetical protein